MMHKNSMLQHILNNVIFINTTLID